MSTPPTYSDHAIPAPRWPELTPALFRHTGALVYLVAADGCVTHVNEALGRVLGETGGAGMTLAGLLERLYPEPEERRAVLASHQQALAAHGTPWEQERLVCTADGERRRVRWAVERQEGAEGPFLAAVGWDRTSGWKLEQWVRLLSQVIARVDEAVVVSDPDGRILHWGGRAPALLGASAAERLDRPLSILFPPPLGARRAEALLGSITGSPGDLRVEELQGPGGAVLRCAVRGFPLVDAQGQPVASAFLAALAPPPAAETVAGPAAPLEDALARSGLVALVATDPEGRVRTWNKGAERLAGRPAGKALDRRALAEVLLLEDLDWPTLWGAVTSRGRQQQRVQVVRPNGTLAAAELEAIPVGAPERPEGALLLLWDRSEQAGQAEELLYAKQAAVSATLAEGLAFRVETALATLAPDRDPLVARLAELRHVARLVADDRPRRDVEAALAVLDLPRAERELDAITFELGEGLHQLRALCTDARDFLATGAEAPRALDLREVAASATALVRHRIPGEWQLQLALDHLPPVRAARGPLLKALCFGLLACAESCARGGGGRISLGGEVRDGWIVLRLEDDGEGYGVDVRSRQGDLVYLSGRPGLGPLMMGVFREEIRNAGGSAELGGAPGTGTVLQVTLPSARASSVLLGLMSEPGASGERPGPVLVLEEDDLFRRGLERLLGVRFETVPAAMVQDVLEAVGQGRFAAAVVGLPRPEGYGLRLVQRLLEANPVLVRNSVILLPPGLRRTTRERLAALGAVLLPRDADVLALSSVLDRMMAER